MSERTYTGQQMVEDVEAEKDAYAQLVIDQIQWAMWYFSDTAVRETEFKPETVREKEDREFIERSALTDLPDGQDIDLFEPKP